MSKLLKPKYETLLKIEKPVLILVKLRGKKKLDRIRLLYPNGNCLWDTFEVCPDYSLINSVSCFVKAYTIDKPNRFLNSMIKGEKRSLKRTVEEMQKFDECFFKIVEIIEL